MAEEKMTVSLSWERLRFLDALAEHGTVAHAAAALHVTAPAVSQQLHKLERESRVRLVEPDGRGVRLTAAGRMLAQHAHLAAEAIRTGEQALAELDDEAVGPLRVGAVGSVVRGILPGAMTRLASEHPRLQLLLHDGEGIHMVPKLRIGGLDLVVIESWSSRPLSLPARVSAERISDEAVSVALHHRHPLADHEQIRLGELADDPWTACPSGTDPHEALLQAMRDAGGEPRVRHELTDYTSQLALVAAGHAVALVPALAQRAAPPEVVFRPCRTRLTRQLVAVSMRGRSTPAVRACVEALRETVIANESPAP